MPGKGRGRPTGNVIDVSLPGSPSPIGSESGRIQGRGRGGGGDVANCRAGLPGSPSPIGREVSSPSPGVAGTATITKGPVKGRAEHTLVECKQFTPRPFQTTLYESAKERNTIICLGTGTGKTHIAIMILKEKSHQTRGVIPVDIDLNTSDNRFKRSIILVPTRPLVLQIAKFIENETDLKVGTYTGATILHGVAEFYTSNFWRKEFEDINVAIMTAEIFNQILTHNCFPMSRINFLVFDECHHTRKNHPYNEIMKHYECNHSDCKGECSEKPLVLGLTASILTQKMSPVMVIQHIEELSKNLHSMVDTWSDLKNIDKYGSKPKESVIEYEPLLSFSPDINQVIEDVTSQMKELLDVFGKMKLESWEKKGKKLVVRSLQHILAALEDLGIWAAERVSFILSEEIGERIAMEKSSTNNVMHMLLLTKTVIDYSLSKFQSILNPVSEQERLTKYSTPRMILLKDYLLTFKPSGSTEGEASDIVVRGSKKGSLCGIIFVQKKADVKVITLWLQQLALTMKEDYGFLKVDYVVGSTATLKMEASSKRQEEVLARFRKHDLNVLVATSVLEEGLDIPRCNLVIRYDLPKNVREYVQSKGRARAEGAKYLIFCPSDPMFRSRKDLNDFREIEDFLKGRIREVYGGSPDGNDDDNIAVDPSVLEVLHSKYTYKTPSGATLSLNSAIGIVNRYCLKLPSDSFTKLVPLFKEGETKEGFTCELRLPINCPVREIIKSDPMPRKTIAKKVVAFKACLKLHSHVPKELDDSLLPIGKTALKEIEKELEFEPYGEEGEEFSAKKLNKDDPRPGTTKRRQYYNKLTADALKGPPSFDETPYILYVFGMKLTCRIPDEQNTRGRKITDPAETPRTLGIIMKSRLPVVCDFPVYTRSGEVMVSLEGANQMVTLSEEQVKRITRFHEYTFHNVLRVDRFPVKFDVGNCDSNFLLVPVDFQKEYVNKEEGWKLPEGKPVDAEIDWNFMEMVYKYETRADYTPSLEERQGFVFRREDFEDTVVRPWYRQTDIPAYYYVGEISDKTPISEFPDMNEYPTFAQYYEKKYKEVVGKVYNRDQPLLDVDHTSARLNLLTPRYVNRKGMTLPMSSNKTKKEKRENPREKQFLVPELVSVHAFPASFWKKIVTLPSLLYRINSLLLADQLRRKVAREIGLIPDSYENVTNKWPALNFGWTLEEALAQQREFPFLSREDVEVDDDDDDEQPHHHHHAKPKPSAKKSKGKRQRHHSKSKSGSSPKPPPVVVAEELPSFPIDHFDPNSVPDVDSDLEDEFEEELLKDVDFRNGLMGGIINIGRPIGQPIGTWDRKTSNAKTNEKPWFDTRPKIVELTDDGDALSTEGDRDLPRVGSPSNFDDLDVDEEDGKPWGETDGNFIDSGLETGVSKISAVGINIEGLCQDLTIGRTFDDVYDSDDSVDEDDEEFGEKVEDRDSLKRKAKPEAVNDIIVHGILAPSPVPPPIDPEEADLAKIIAEIPDAPDSTPVRNGSHAVSDLDVPSRHVRLQLESILEDMADDDSDGKISPKEPVKEDLQQQPRLSEQEIKEKLNDTETNFGELLPSHRRLEMQGESTESHMDKLKFDAMKADVDSLLGPSPSMILQALTLSNAGDGINLERLETVGDSFLKYAVTLFLYCRCPNIHEGKLSYLRSRQISNFNLYRLGKRKGFGNYIIGAKFAPRDNWLPPGYIVPKGLDEALMEVGDPSVRYNLGELKKMEKDLDKMTPKEFEEEVLKKPQQFLLSGDPSDNNNGDENLNTFKEVDNNSNNNNIRIPYNLLSQQSIPDKSIADCVEALIGSYLLEAGPKGALLVMKWLGLKVMYEESEVEGKWPQEDLIWHHLPPVKSPLQVLDVKDPDFESKKSFQRHQMDKLYEGSGLQDFEKNVLDYEFRDKAYLIQAFTHNSYYENQITDCYQRLEFLGDAILDFLVTRLLYEDPKKHSPGILTDLRSALVNNTFFASLAVEYKFHKYLKNLSHDLLKVKTDFVDKFNAKFYRDQLNVFIAEDETESCDDVEVPKALGDIFESVAGAIFLDSGMSLDAVWKVYYRMMKPEIEHFSNHVPKSPIRELLETEPQKAQFGKPEVIPGKKVRVCVEIFGYGKFFGVGRNKRIAKCTAAKKALRRLREIKGKQLQKEED